MNKSDLSTGYRLKTMFKTLYNKFDLIMPTSETGSPKILLGVQSIITNAFYITIFSRS